MKTTVRIIGHFGGYRKMFSFGWTCLVYHATTLFCSRNFSYKNDALGKTVGQMVGAARSARQNINAGMVFTAGAGAHAVVRPIQNVVDPSHSGESQLVSRLRLSRLGDILESAAGCRRGRAVAPSTAAIAVQRKSRFGRIAARSGVRALPIGRVSQYREPRPIPKCRRASKPMAQKERSPSLFARVDDILNWSHHCVRGSACGSKNAVGGPMRKMVTKKGRNAGNPFWSCTGYPECDGTRNFGR